MSVFIREAINEAVEKWSLTMRGVALSEGEKSMLVQSILEVFLNLQASMPPPVQDAPPARKPAPPPAKSKRPASKKK